MSITNAFNINDRGEILAKAAPVGFTPEDDADLGHLVLLIPCDREDEGCPIHDREMDEVSSQIAPIRGQGGSGTNVTLRHQSTPSENVAAWGARLSQKYHVPTIGGPR